jgi:VIT1/CCC1 family predicted Fe2+/Mn2+ transporter
MRHYHPERHYAERIGWLRAAVLGANDGIVSIASLVVGVAAADVSSSGVLVAGVAGGVAGAMSMASGEYVSVSSQADSERADLDRERLELQTDLESEHKELEGIYVGRGLDPALAEQVAVQLMAHDALGAHARDELGLSDVLSPNPMLAALASGAAFSVGAALPLATYATSPSEVAVPVVVVSSLIFLVSLGAGAARTGGASVMVGALRVTLWGALAMGVTAAIGRLFGTVL